MARMSAWVLALASLIGTACGGDGPDEDRAGGRVPDGTRTGSAAEQQPPSGVAATRTVAELSLQEAQQVCEWTVRLGLSVEAATVEQECVLYAGAGSVAECEEIRDLCIEDYEAYSSAPDEQLVAESAALCVAFLALGADQACQVTVAELEACMRADAAAYESSFADVTCESVVSAQAEGWQELEEPEALAACTLLEEKCPTWFQAEVDDEPAEEPFVCDDGADIPASWECDGTPDCYDGEDEHGC
jgi:hypothetical protein